MPNRNDVAKLAGVSSATVSRVINQTGKVSEDLKERVFSAISALNYQPNQAAINLRTQKNYLVVYIVPDILNPFYTEIFKGVVAVLNEVGYHCHLIEYNQINILPKLNNYDVIISSVELSKEDLTTIQRPIIYEGLGEDEIEGHSYFFIDHDIKTPLNDVYNRLYNDGHHEFALIAQSRDKNIQKQIFIDFHRSKGIEFNTNAMCEFSDYSYQYDVGYNCTNSLFDNKIKFTSLFAENDLIAIGAIKSIKEHGFKIPEDICIVGCDDTIAAAYSQPPLTTIKRLKNRLGQLLASSAIRIIAGDPVNSILLEATVIYRESTNFTH